MKAIILTANGDPLETLQLSEIPEPGAPEKGEVIIRMEYSPVHPSDLMVAQGVYFVQPTLPSVIGVEGVGIIETVSPGVDNVKPGDRVNVPYGTYSWAELIKAPAKNLVVLPQEIDVQQASMIAANPVTAVLLLDEFVKLKKGDWIVLNAANSSVANAIISVAKSRGLRVLAIVRRADAVPVAEKTGADIVLVESPTVADEAKKATGGVNITLGLDAVGGESAGILATILGNDSHLVAYAILSGKPIVVSQIDIIPKQMTVHGFWMYLPKYLLKHHEAIEEAAGLVNTKKLIIPISAVYPLSAIKEAVEHTQKGEKVLLDFKL